MAHIRIDFNWWRDSSGSGFRLVVGDDARPVAYHAPLNPPDLAPLPENWGLVYHPFGIRVLDIAAYTPPYVVRAGAEALQIYRPLDLFASLYTQFAAIQTADEVLHFIEKFGPLTLDGLDPQKGELVGGVIIHAEAIRELLDYSSSAGRQRNSALIAGKMNPFAGLEVNLDVDPADASLQLRISPASLLDALWLQAVQKLSSGATVRQCRHCGRWFETGGGTGRRVDATFCSKKHQVTFNSLKRSRGR